MSATGNGNVWLNGRLVFAGVEYSASTYEAAGGPAVRVTADDRRVGPPYPACLRKLGVYTIKPAEGGIEITGG